MQRAFHTDAGEAFSLTMDAGSRIGAGGQGQVYTACIGGQTVAVKLMRNADAGKLRAFQQLEPQCGDLATLPKHLVYRVGSGQGQELAGYAMRRLDPGRTLSAARLFNFEEIGKLTRYTWGDAVLAALRLAESVALMQRHGVVIGDLNPENVLFEQRPLASGGATWRAILLDTDSFQIEAPGGQRHHWPVSRPPYTAPELIGCDFSLTWRASAADVFSLAVVIDQLLLHDHPYDNAFNTQEPDLEVTARIRRGLYPQAIAPAPGLRPSPFRPAPLEISEGLHRAFQRSFGTGAAGAGLPQRPTAAEWVVLLQELHRQVVPCRSSPHHHHPRGMACPWCALDRKVGQPLCAFPSPAPRRRPTQSLPAPACASLQDRYGSLLQELEAEVRRGQRLARQGFDLRQRLEQLEPRLCEVVSQAGTPGSLIDRGALEARIHPLRTWMSRLAGHHDKLKRRQETLEQLGRFAEETATGVRQAAIALEERRRALLARHRSLLEPLPNLPRVDESPAAIASARVAAAIGEFEERWLSRELEHQPIRSWQIEGFGEARLALLEGRGLVNGEHLRRPIDRLTELPGIGRGLQARLRSHLDGVLGGLRSTLDRHTWPLRLADLLPPARASGIGAAELALQALQRDLEALETALADLQQGIANQLRKRDRLQVADRRTVASSKGDDATVVLGGCHDLVEKLVPASGDSSAPSLLISSIKEVSNQMVSPASGEVLTPYVSTSPDKRAIRNPALKSRAVQRVWRPFARSPTMGPRDRHRKPVENPEIRCAAMQRAAPRNHWGLRRCPGCARIQQGPSPQYWPAFCPDGQSAPTTGHHAAAATSSASLQPAARRTSAAWVSHRAPCSASPRAWRSRSLAAKAAEASARLAGRHAAVPAGRLAGSPTTGGGSGRGRPRPSATTAAAAPSSR
jgi:serine/threonine protein kinase